MKVFLTGGSGFLGRSVITKLVSEGHSVIALVRSEESGVIVKNLGATPILGDITKPKYFSDAINGIEIAIHCAAPVEFWGPWEKFQSEIADATRLVAMECEKQKVRRFIYISSESVLQNTNRLLDIDEKYPYPPEPNSYYGKAKKLAEEFLLSMSGKMEVIILRPSYIWGPGSPSFDTLIGKAKSGQFMWIDKGTASFEAVHIENVAEAVSLSLTQGQNRGIYFITDGENSTTREFFENLFKALNAPIPTKSVPSLIMQPIARIIESIWKIFNIKGHPPITRFDLAFVGMPRRYIINRSKHELNYQPVIDRKSGFLQISKLMGSSF